MKRAFIAVEGPHDVELIGALFRSLDPKRRRVRLLAELDDFWRPLVPERFPHQGDLARRVPVPVFFVGGSRSLAVMADRGDSGVVDSIRGALDALNDAPDIIDADDLTGPARWDRFRASKAARELGDLLPTQAGRVLPGPSRVGAFVLPDGEGPGTLEDLLLDAAGIVYPTLLAGAETYIADAAPHIAALPRDDRKAIQKPAGARKATVACVGAILKPGKAIQASIQDNCWFRTPEALALPRVAAAREWLADLLELSLPR